MECYQCSTFLNQISPVLFYCYAVSEKIAFSNSFLNCNWWSVSLFSLAWSIRQVCFCHGDRSEANGNRSGVPGWDASVRPSTKQDFWIHGRPSESRSIPSDRPACLQRHPVGSLWTAHSTPNRCSPQTSSPTSVSTRPAVCYKFRPPAAGGGGRLLVSFHIPHFRGGDPHPALLHFRHNCLWRNSNFSAWTMCSRRMDKSKAGSDWFWDPPSIQVGPRKPVNRDATLTMASTGHDMATKPRYQFGANTRAWMGRCAVWSMHFLCDKCISLWWIFEICFGEVLCEVVLLLFFLSTEEWLVCITVPKSLTEWSQRQDFFLFSFYADLLAGYVWWGWIIVSEWLFIWRLTDIYFGPMGFWNPSTLENWYIHFDISAVSNAPKFCFSLTFTYS